MELDDQSKGNYQPWNHEVFMADRHVRKMKSHTRKSYAMLLHEMFFCTTRPYLPDNDQDLYAYADCDSIEEWLGMKDEILRMFEKVTLNGARMLYHKRVAEDWDRMVDAREKRIQKAKIAGTISGIKRRAKHLIQEQEELNRTKSNSEFAESNSTEPSKSKRELKQESKEEENPVFGFEEQEHLHGDEMNAVKQITLLCKSLTGSYADMSPLNTAKMKALEVEHKGSAVVNIFTLWAKDHKNDELKRPITAFLSEADELFATPSSHSYPSPENGLGKRISREISYISKMDVNLDKRQTALVVAEMQEEKCTEEDVYTVFRKFNDDIDRTRASEISFAGKKFSEIVGAMLGTLQRQRQERTSEQTLMDAAREKMTKEANERVAEMLRKEQEELAGLETELS